MVFLEKRTLGELVLRAAKIYRNKTAFQIYRDGGIYGRLSYAEFGRKALVFAALLRKRGIASGGRVMLLAENRSEWPVAYFGIALAGAVTVPVLTDFSGEQIKTIAEHSGSSMICVTERTAAKAAALNLPLIMLDSEELFEDNEAPAASDSPPINEGDPASIIYTSGTTGASKGVVLSHRNLTFIAQASRSLMKIFSRDRLLSVIPLAHTYECSLGLITAVMSGASVTYLDKPPSPAVLLPAMQTLRPTAMISVPLFIEKICRNRIFPVLERNPLYRFRPTRILALKAAGARLMAALGSSVRFFGIGGAPLDEEVERFLKTTGFPYSTGYGLTECSPLVAGASPYRFSFRSSGSVLKEVELRLSEEGEIQVRGPNVMLGYFRDEEKTREVFTEDGWLKTGDLGFLDKKGFLHIRGRIKTLILGPSGENIYPEEIESLMQSSSLVEDVLVVPGNRGELVALIVLSEKAQTAIAALGDSLEELKNSVNKRLAAFSRLSRIEVRKEPFEKTPTQKIKRFLYSGAKIF